MTIKTREKNPNNKNKKRINQKLYVLQLILRM